MEISELLRRGNFSRSQVFRTRQQLSQQSLFDQEVNSVNENNSKSPSKGKLQSKNSMNATRITDNQSNSSQIGKDNFFFAKKSVQKDQNGKNIIRNSSQIFFNDESMQQTQEGNKKKNNQSTIGFYSSAKSESQLSQNIEDEIQQGRQNTKTPIKNMYHKKIQSMDQYSISQRGQGASLVHPQSQQQSRRNKDSKSIQYDKLSEIFSKSIKSPKKNIYINGLNGAQPPPLQLSKQTNTKKGVSELFSSTFMNDHSPMPKTSKQYTLLESSKSQAAPYFKGLKSENNNNNNNNNSYGNSIINNLLLQHNNTSANAKIIKKDNREVYPDKKEYTALSQSQITMESIVQDIDKQKATRNQTTSKSYRSQEKYIDLSATKNSVLSKINPFFSTTTKGSNKQIATFGKRTSAENIHIGKLKPPVSEFSVDEEIKTKKVNISALSKQDEVTQNNGISSSNNNNNDEQQPQKGSLFKSKISSIMGIVKAKRKITSLLRQSQDLTKKKGSDESSSDSERLHQNKNKKNTNQLHQSIVNDLKNETGCEIHDIYGTFNDKIKQLQEQVYEALNNYSLAQTMIEHVEKEKNQSRVIDVVENMICSIFLSLDFLEKIPQHMNEREEIDKILAQQAISLMKSTQANLIIQIETVMIYAKYCKAICNFGKALRLYKQCKNMSLSNLTQRYRMKSYKSIGQCFQNLKLYQTSLLYFGKYLECAWFLGDTEAELKAYDYIGVTYYLLGDLETAKFYHEKMIQNDNEPAESNVRMLNNKKMVEKLKKLNTEEYQQKMAVSYKKFFAKIHSIDYDEDYECSSSDDEFKINIPKTSSQKKNREYEEYMRDLSPNAKKKMETEKKRFIAIYNAEDRVAQKQIKQQANSNIRMLEFKRMAFQLPPQLKFSSAQSFKPINNTQKNSFRINQFSINRNLDNYLAQDQRILKLLNFDFFKQVEDTNDKKLKNKIIYILSKFQNNLIFALSQIHCLRERDKYKQKRRRFAFSGVADFNKPNNLILMNINISQEKMQQFMEERRKIQHLEDRSKPNSNKQKFMFIQRFQMHPEVEAYIKK